MQFSFQQALQSETTTSGQLLPGGTATAREPTLPVPSLPASQSRFRRPRLNILQRRNDTANWARRGRSGRYFCGTTSDWTKEEARPKIPFTNASSQPKPQFALSTVVKHCTVSEPIRVSRAYVFSQDQLSRTVSGNLGKSSGDYQET